MIRFTIVAFLASMLAVCALPIPRAVHNQRKTAHILAKGKSPPAPPPPPPPPPPPQFETQASYRGKVGGAGQAGARTGGAVGGAGGTSDMGLIGDITAAMSQVGKSKNLGS